MIEVQRLDLVEVLASNFQIERRAGLAAERSDAIEAGLRKLGAGGSGRQEHNRYRRPESRIKQVPQSAYPHSEWRSVAARCRRTLAGSRCRARGTWWQGRLAGRPA